MASTKYQTEAARWAAVRARDPAADGAFVYSVKTTKIYCRPTCKARLARRSNVEFYTQPQEAVSNGFRPCKRCKPELDKFVPEADQSIDRIRLLLENLPDDAPLPKLESLASDAGLTKYHFHRCFKKATGMTPREYALSRRSNRQMVGVQQSATTGEVISHTSTPSLVSDSAASGSILTPISTDFNFDDWLADGSDPTLPIEAFPSDTETFDMTQNQDIDTSLEEAIKTAITYDIHYTTVETTGGVLLMAFQDSQICKLELLTTPYEAIGSLEESFPTCIYVHTPAEMLPDDQRIPIQMRIATVAAALECPIGEGARSFQPVMQ